jgi:hypothetical protein
VKRKALKQSIPTAAEEVLETTQPRKVNGWFREDCQTELGIRNEARRKMSQRGKTANALEYADARKEVKTICCRKKKKEYEEDIIQELQDRYPRNEVRKFYEGVCNIKRSCQQRVTVCQDKTGNLTAGERQLLNMWSDNKVRELIAVNMLQTSLLNITVVAFKVPPLGSYALMPAPSPSYKTLLELVLWNGLHSCHCINPDVIKMPSFRYFLYLPGQKKSLGARSSE